MVPESLSEEQIADTRRALEDLARALGRISARVCHEMGIQFDMDDPEVAREVMKMPFEGLFYSSPRSSRGRSRTPAPAPIGLPE